MITVRVALAIPTLKEDRDRLPWFGSIYWCYCQDGIVFQVSPPPTGVCVLGKS